MTVQSSTFGGVTLTGDDAKKFVNQITYGRPRREAAAAVARGVEMMESLSRNGKVSFRLKDGKLQHIIKPQEQRGG